MPTINTTEDSRPFVQPDMACTAGDDEDREDEGAGVVVWGFALALAFGAVGAALAIFWPLFGGGR